MIISLVTTDTQIEDVAVAPLAAAARVVVVIALTIVAEEVVSDEAAGWAATMITQILPR